MLYLAKTITFWPGVPGRPVKSSIIAAALLLMLAAPHVQAKTLSPLQMDEGRYLTSLCTTCHQPGKKADGIPRITGYSSKQMMEMMMDYRGGQEHHGAMENIAQSLTDSELRVLSAYLALTSPPKASAEAAK